MTRQQAIHRQVRIELAGCHSLDYLRGFDIKVTFDTGGRLAISVGSFEMQCHNRVLL